MKSMASRVHVGIRGKILALGLVAVILPSALLLATAAWQSGQFNDARAGGVDRARPGGHRPHRRRRLRPRADAGRHRPGAGRAQPRASPTTSWRPRAASGPSTATATWTAVNQTTGDDDRRSPCRGSPSATTWLGQNTDPPCRRPSVDRVKALVGGEATIFQRMNDAGDMLRVATTVTTTEGARAVGTYIAATAADGSRQPGPRSRPGGRHLPRHRRRRGQRRSSTAYEPIRDAGRRRHRHDLRRRRSRRASTTLREAIMATKVGKSGLRLRPRRQGRRRGPLHHLGRRQARRREHHGPQERRRPLPDPGDRRRPRSPWSPASSPRSATRGRTSGDPAPRMKFARLAYYAPWDWVIGVSAYEDDFAAVSANLDAGRDQMLRHRSCSWRCCQHPDRARSISVLSSRGASSGGSARCRRRSPRSPSATPSRWTRA